MKRYVLILGVLALALVHMPPAMALSIIGRVVDGQGDPVAGASVWVSQEGRVYQDETGADGAYRLDALRVGGIELTVLKTGFAIAGKTAFAVGDTNIDLTLTEPGSASLRILDRRARPIPGARVKAMGVGGQFLAPVKALAAHGFPPLRSNDAGVIEIPFVPAGDYVIAIVQHNDYIESPPIFLLDGQAQSDTVLRDGLRLRGRVLNSDDEPMPETRVSLFQNTPAGQEEISETTTDGDGLFRFVVPTGVYFVALRHPDYASPEPVQVGLSDSTEDDVHVFTLLTPCIVSGRVLLPDGSGAGGVRVAYREGDVIYEDVFTDVEGKYMLKVPGNIDGFLRIDAPPGYMTDLTEALPLSIGDQKFVHVQDFTLLSLPHVSGVVLEEEEPAAHVLVTTMNLGSPSMALTNAAGEFTLGLGDMPKGRILWARAEHPLRFLRKDFAVHLDQPRPVELTLEPFTANQEQKPEANYRNDLDALLNEPAPPFECVDWLNSDSIQLSDLRGKVVVLTFWAGFDQTPIGLNRIQEMRAMHALYADTDDVVVIGIHDGGSPLSEVAGYLRYYGITFPVGRDKEPLTSSDSWTFDSYGVNAVPQTVLLDKQGVLRYYQTEGRLLELIKVLRRRN